MHSRCQGASIQTNQEKVSVFDLGLMEIEDRVGRAPASQSRVDQNRIMSPKILPKKKPGSTCIVTVWQAFVDPLKIGVLMSFEVE